MSTNNGLVGAGGFYFPQIYERNQKEVIEALKAGTIDYADLSQWSFSDEFLCFALQSGFFKYADKTYPNPRSKNEVPIWFLVSCQFLLKLNQSSRYHQLKYLMNAGSVLSRVGFNVSSTVIGFNKKNKLERKTAVDSDTVRKFFKDTAPLDLRAWHNNQMQSWFKSKQAYHEKGIFILDQSHLVVPDNPNYKMAVRMPVDSNGQLYKHIDLLSKEQKKVLPYHPCYTMSTLLHIGPKLDWFHISGYELGPGNEDELPQAERLIPSFCNQHPGLMKELIMDRGYIDGSFVSKLKRDYDVDSLLPLKKNMSSYCDALDIANRENKWTLLTQVKDSSGKLMEEIQVTEVGGLDLWDACSVKQYATVAKQKTWDEKTQCYEERPWVLGATKKYASIGLSIERYRFRTQVEERYRQFKHSWEIANFSSPDESLIESQICFTLLTYSSLQLYLRRNDLQSHTHKMIQTLRQEEALGKNVVLVYAQNQFAILNLDDYSMHLLTLDAGSAEKIKQLMLQQKEARLKRSS